MTSDTSKMSLGAGALAAKLADGTLTALDLAEACIARIEAREPEIRAWAWFDAEHVRAEARRLDDHRASGAPLGPLHGLPVGLKDVIDTAGIPTENGCPVDAGRVPERDACIVEKLKAAGALIVGKTVTTELAFLHPGKTRNPRNTGHTPGGSSSGSAAAVADGMIPLAVGTQTGGSVIRPASFCGITGFKPSFGAIPRRGVLMQSHTLDTLGTFATDPEGAALLAEALFGSDPGDAATAPAPVPRLREAVQSEPDAPPVFAFVHPPGWDRADPALRTALDAFAEGLGAQVFSAELPPIIEDAAQRRATLNGAEMAHYYRRYMDAGADRLGPETRAAISTGEGVTASEYLEAVAYQNALGAALAPLFARCDAILCPAALGPAPETLASTGDSIFNGLWTLAGTPAVTLPFLTAPNGLPMGVQLVGPRFGDAALLRTAGWLWRRAGATAG